MRNWRGSEVEKMLKWIARKILDNEIKYLEAKANAFEHMDTDIAGEKEKLRQDYESKINELEKAKNKSDSEKIESERRYAELEKENEILRKYYDLNKEPSDEIKMKMHIDLELNRVKEENLKLIALANRQPQCTPIPMPYPQYSPFWRF